MNKKAKSLLKGIIVLALLGVIIFFGIKLIIKNDKFVLEYIKEKPFVGTKFLPDQNLKIMIYYRKQKKN